MKLFDPHIHMSSRTTADYEAMAAAGIEVRYPLLDDRMVAFEAS